MNHGKIAYETYCKTTDNKSLISGAELPPWEKLDPKIQEAWTAAGLAVGNAVLNKTIGVVADSVQEAARRGFESIQHKGS